MSNPDTYSKNDKRFWMGIFLVIIGGIWLLNNLNLIPPYIQEYVINWRSFLILLGLYLIIGRKKTEPGIVLIAIGSLFLLDDMDFFHWRDILHIFWPLVLIVIGISLMLRRSYGGFKRNIKDESVDFVDDFAIFGGRERIINSPNFRGGKLTVLFGGSEIDLRDAELAEGTNELDVFVMFGGTEIIVPSNWAVQIEVFSLLGNFADKRLNSIKVVPEPGKTLVIKGFVMFGGGDVKLNK